MPSLHFYLILGIILSCLLEFIFLSQLCAENSPLCLDSLLQISIPAAWTLIYTCAQVVGFLRPFLWLFKILLISSILAKFFHDSQMPRLLTCFLILDLPFIYFDLGLGIQELWESFSFICKMEIIVVSQNNGIYST